MSDTTEASDTREHHKVTVSVRTLTDTEQQDRKTQANALNPGGTND